MNEETRKWLCNKALESAPLEACGFIMKDGTIIECLNIAKNPTSAFEMSSKDLIEKLAGHDLSSISGIWHTHPRGTNYPSKTDVHAMNIGAIHEDWDYYIVTKDEVTQWNPKDYAPKQNSFWKEFSSLNDAT